MILPVKRDKNRGGNNYEKKNCNYLCGGTYRNDDDDCVWQQRRGGSEKTSDGKTKVRFATWDVADDVDAQQKLVDKFNQEHDDIEVVLEAYGSDFDTKLSAGMGSGDTPDVVYMWNYPAYADGLEPLDEYIDKEGEEYKDNFYSALWNYNSFDGTTYGIPVGFTTHALFYNKDLFAEAGVEEPTDSWTWSDLQTAAKTIEEKPVRKGLHSR